MCPDPGRAAARRVPPTRLATVPPDCPPRPPGAGLWRLHGGGSVQRARPKSMQRSGKKAKHCNATVDHSILQCRVATGVFTARGVPMLPFPVPVHKCPGSGETSSSQSLAGTLTACPISWARHHSPAPSPAPNGPRRCRPCRIAELTRIGLRHAGARQRQPEVRVAASTGDIGRILLVKLDCESRGRQMSAFTMPRHSTSKSGKTKAAHQACRAQRGSAPAFDANSRAVRRPHRDRQPTMIWFADLVSGRGRLVRRHA